MITIHKYTLDIKGFQQIEIPGYQQCLSVKRQRHTLVLYALVDTNPALRAITLPVRIVGTGNTAEVEDYRFVNTVMMPNGLVWHVFVEEPE